jgi:DNA-binding PadR family transcriptional regulator
MTPEEVIEALKELAEKKHHDYNLTQREDYLQDHEALSEAIRLIEEYRQRQVSIYEILHNLEKNGWEIPKEIDEWWKKETYLNEARKD